ncbi:hypothetical protein LXL04_034367 [Taraxacum kok-saghyz]
MVAYETPLLRAWELTFNSALTVVGRLVGTDDRRPAPAIGEQNREELKAGIAGVCRCVFEPHELCESPVAEAEIGDLQQRQGKRNREESIGESPFAVLSESPLQHVKHSKINPTKGSIRTVGRHEDDLIEGAGKAYFILPNGTHFLINNALFSPKSNRNLLGFGDVYLNGYDTLTKTIENEKYMLIIDENRVLEKLPKFDSNLHYTYMNIVESNMVVKEKCCDPGIFSLWHDRLGHPGLTMMRRIIENTHGHPLKDQKFLQ